MGHRSLSALLVVGLALGGCDDDETLLELSIDLRSDWVAGVEFVGARVTVDGELQGETASGDDTFVNGRRLFDLSELAAASRRVIRLDLIDATGGVHASRQVLVDHQEDIAVTVVMSRDCSSVTCGTNESCLGGRCVDQECTDGTEEVCEDPACAVDSDCPAMAECSVQACRDGICLYDAVECDPGLYCAAETGCVPIPVTGDMGTPPDLGLPDDSIYISPMGDDGAAGTMDAPLRTFVTALGRLGPGDELVALPGTYGTSTGTGLLDIDCRTSSTSCGGGPCVQGTSAQPITIRASAERQARLEAEPGDESSPIYLGECSHYDVSGFTVLGLDDASNPWQTIDVHASTDVSLRRNLIARSNRAVNGHLLIVGGSTDVLIEENELYDFHRAGLSIYQSRRVTARRNYVNSRSYDDIAGGYVSLYPTGGDSALGCSHSADCLFENNLVEGDTEDAFEIGTSLAVPDGLGGEGDGIGILGNLVRGTVRGVFANSACSGVTGCMDIDERVIDGLEVRDHVVVATSEHGIFVRGALDVTLRNVTIVDATVRIDETSASAELDSSATLTNVAVSSGGGVGITVHDQTSWAIRSCNSFGPGSGFDTAGDDSGLMATTEIDPMLGGCVHRVPASSPLSGAGEGGENIGATVVHRYEDGTLTTTPLWGSDGSFPCGAVVAGINDGANDCTSAHTRLGVGGACAVE